MRVAPDDEISEIARRDADELAPLADAAPVAVIDAAVGRSGVLGALPESRAGRGGR